MGERREETQLRDGVRPGARRRTEAPHTLGGSSTVRSGSVYTGQIELGPNLPDRQHLRHCSLRRAHVGLKPDKGGRALGCPFLSGPPDLHELSTLPVLPPFSLSVDVDPVPCLGPDLFVLKSLANDCKEGLVSSNVSRRVLEGFLSNTNAGPGAPPPSGLPPRPAVRTRSHRGPQCVPSPSALEPVSGADRTQSRGSRLGWRRQGIALC